MTEMEHPAAATDRAAVPPSTWVLGALVLLALVASLVTYKASGSLTALARAQATRTLSPPAEPVATTGSPALLRPLVRTYNYLAIVWPALLFGVVIGAAVRALIPAAWVGRFFARSAARAQLAGGLAGVPLMLCSCCIAPVFAALHERTRQAGPPGALLLASPSLNPAALALTFLLFAPAIGLARLTMAVLLVFGVSAVAARYVASRGTEEAAPSLAASVLAPCPLELAPPRGPAGVLGSFAREVWSIARSTLPVIALGVLLSSLLLEAVTLDGLRAGTLPLATIMLVALVSVPVALPTFAEIPLALGLLAAGAPAGAATALLIAGPAINLPSLLTVSRMTTPRYAAALATGTFLVALAGGLVVR